MSITIYFAKSLRNIEAKADQYNQDKYTTDATGRVKHDHSSRIRKNHLQLCEILLRRYTRQLQRGRRGDKATVIMANNRQLAAELNCSERTIINLLARLVAAGIVSKRFKGSEFAYEITFPGDVLQTAAPLSPAAVQAEIMAADQEAATEEISQEIRAFSPLEGMKKFPHNINTKNYNNTPIIAKASNVETSAQAPEVSTLDSLSTELETPAKHKAEYTENSPPVARTPRRSMDNLKQIQQLTADLWAYTLTALYPQARFISITQTVYAQSYFAAELLQCPPDQIHRRYLSLQFRLSLVKSFLDRKPGRYIPLPCQYFNPANTKGFASTAAWEQQAKNATEKRIKAAKDHEKHLKIYQQFAALVNTFDTYNLKAYQAARQKIENMGGPALTEAYHNLIVNHLQKSAQ